MAAPQPNRKQNPWRNKPQTPLKLLQNILNCQKRKIPWQASLYQRMERKQGLQHLRVGLY